MNEYTLVRDYSINLYSASKATDIDINWDILSLWFKGFCLYYIYLKRREERK